MTVQEVREHPEYFKSMEKIKSYPAGFKFTLNYSNIPKPQANALKIVLFDACEMGLLKSCAMHLTLSGDLVGEEFERTGVVM